MVGRRRAIRAGVAVLGVLVVAGLVRVLLASAPPLVEGPAPGATGGCPPTDNCVSSLATEPAWQVDPLACAAVGDALDAAVADALPRASVAEPGRVEARTLVVGFVDDVVVEPRGDGTVDVVSSSRVGSSDLGANRERVEDLRVALADDPRCD